VKAPDDPLAACAAAREALLDLLHRSRGQAEAREVEFHCVHCRSWFGRARLLGQALAALPRVPTAPETQAAWTELDGRVVAELQAGRRQERAAASLSSLKRASAPAELEALVVAAMDSGAVLRHPAPGELDTRVASEIASSGQARIARQVAALERVAPPFELQGRVQAVISRVPRSDSLPIQRWLAVAATLLVVFGAASMVERSVRDPAPEYPFRVVHVESAASLDPFVRGLLAASSGGVLDLPASSARASGEQRR